MMTLFIPQTEHQMKAVLDYVAERVGDFNRAFAQAAMASVKDGRIIGAVVYHNFRTTDIEMVCAGEPGWLNRTALKAYFAYPFMQLGCRRVSVIIHRKNKRSRAFVEKLGWKMEGVHRKAMADGHDAISYGMLKENCRWLGEDYGQEEIRRSRAA